MIRTQYKTDVKAIRMDNGNVFGGERLAKVLREHGTILETTALYTPEQDGVAERTNRIILDKVRSLIMEDVELKPFWPELMKGVAYITNRTATNALDNKTPYVSFTKEQPQMGHIQVLGCPAYTHIQKRKSVANEVQSLNPVLKKECWSDLRATIFTESGYQVVMALSGPLQSNLMKSILNDTLFDVDDELTVNPEDQQLGTKSHSAINENDSTVDNLNKETVEQRPSKDYNKEPTLIIKYPARIEYPDLAHLVS